MKVYYGVDNNRIDITSKIMEYRQGDIISLPSYSYNTMFGDPVYNIEKALILESELLDQPVYIKENTYFTLNMSNYSDTPIIVVYALDQSYEWIDDLNRIKSSGLYDRSSLYIDMVGDTSIVRNIVPKAIINTHNSNSLVTAHNLSKSRNGIIFHMKSLSKGRFRDRMMSFLVDKWRHNINILHLLPSIDKVCCYSYNNGLIPHNWWYIRSSFLSKEDIPYGGIWPRSSNTIHNIYNIQRCDGKDGLHISLYQSGRSYNIGCGCIGVHQRYNKKKGIYKIEDASNNVSGLFNQLNNICNSIILAHMTGRDIYDPRFRPQFDVSNTIPLSMIVDISYLHNYLRSMGIDTRIVYDRIGEMDILPDRDDVGRLFLPTPIILDRIDTESRSLDIGCAMPDPTRTVEASYILRDMKFCSIYEEVVDYCISQIGKSYSSVHLRLEDDWIVIYHGCGHVFELKTYELWSMYKHYMSIMFQPTDKLYIATHLGKGSNRNTFILDELRSLYPNAITYISWRDRFELPIGREIDALIDYLICRRSEKFIGTRQSSFSIAVSQMLELDNRKVINI